MLCNAMLLPLLKLLLCPGTVILHQDAWQRSMSHLSSHANFGRCRSLLKQQEFWFVVNSVWPLYN